MAATHGQHELDEALPISGYQSLEVGARAHERARTWVMMYEHPMLSTKEDVHLGMGVSPEQGDVEISEEFVGVFKGLGSPMYKQQLHELDQ